MTTFLGSCHCGGVNFLLDVEESLGPYFRCDCSLCWRRGAVMGAAPRESLIITMGQALLSRYRWNTGQACHYFCSICGIYTHHDMRVEPNRIAINMGCIEGINAVDLAGTYIWEGRQLSSLL